ncbi:MAG TPA: putative Ig domain-containing protein [Longimicrobium sp.]|nr:putative Ig domain-containing protein [Longimicrobium sp.]
MRRRSTLPVISLLLALFSVAHAAPAAAQQRVEGWFHILWGIQERAPGVIVQHLLTDDAGRTWRLRLDARVTAPWGGPLALDRTRVTVTGRELAAAAGTAERVLEVAEIAPRASPAPAAPGGRAVRLAAQSGSKPYVTLLCRFADSTSLMPKSKAEYERMLTGSAYPGMDHYWRELSDGRIDLAGSRVAGWYDLPDVKAAYFERNTDGTVDPRRLRWGKLLADCAGRADADVDFRQFFGINLQVNGSMIASWGGSWPATLDGVTRSYPVTWMANWAGYATYGHEIGHSLGLPHSSGPYGQVYDSRWDVMSGGGRWDEELIGGRAFIPVHTIGYHKDLLAWVPSERKYVAAYGPPQTITLHRVAAPPAEGGHVLAQIPLPAGRFYTVEARRVHGYDAAGGIPGEAVVIHKVDPYSDGSHALVVDADGNEDANDDGAMWMPGEVFTDAANEIQVSVEAETATGFRVRIAWGGSAVAIATDSVRIAAQGVAYADTLRASGGLGAYTWSVTSGSLPSGVTLGASSGVLAGTPRSLGIFDFTATAASGTWSASKSYTLRVYPPVLIASDTLRPPGVAGVEYADTLVAGGGDGTFGWALTGGALPPGLALDAAGRVAGTPAQAGTFRYTATAASTALSASRTFTLVVLPPLAIMSDSLRSGAAGSPYADTLRAAGGPGSRAWSIAAGALPAGLSLDAGTGVVSGTPGATGDFAVTVQLAAGAYTATRAYTLRVHPALVIASDAQRPGAVMGAAYADSLAAAGGSGAVSWRVTQGRRPAGLTLDAASGRVRGTPEEAGTFTYTAAAATGALSQTRAFVLTVAKPQLAAAAVLDQLLGTGSLTADQLRFLDLLGNRNGRLDVGDVRAWLLDSGTAGASAAELQKVLDAMDPGRPPAPAATDPATGKETR